MPVEPLTASHSRAPSRKPPVWLRTNYPSDLKIEEANRVMLTTKAPLADIALIFGFGDQGYFTRVFSAGVGCSPCSWCRPLDNRRVSYAGLIISRA